MGRAIKAFGSAVRWVVWRDDVAYVRRLMLWLAIVILLCTAGLAVGQGVPIDPSLANTVAGMSVEQLLGYIALCAIGALVAVAVAGFRMLSKLAASVSSLAAQLGDRPCVIKRPFSEDVEQQ